MLLNMPAVLAAVLMSLTFSIAGIALGFIAYAVIQVQVENMQNLMQVV